jgi:hypothetical protein
MPGPKNCPRESWCGNLNPPFGYPAYQKEFVWFQRINRTIVLNAAQYPMVDRMAEYPLPSYIILDLTKGGATRYSRLLNRIEEARLESGILNYRIRNTEAERGMGKAHDSDRKIRVTP